ncbi:MAG: C-terminal target protein [Phycisphaerales bacterium]|nr:C-terminal target protein [Phycisphaerales bacterium]
MSDSYRFVVRPCASVVWSLTLALTSISQANILFDNTKSEQAGNADWVIDSDGTSAQRTPTPAQSGITAATAETYWNGGISAWGVTMVKRGQAVETLPVGTAITFGSTTNAQDLSHYSVYAVTEPNKLFTAAEKTAIINFVKNGGSLFMIADHGGADRDNDGVDATDAWNDLISTANTAASGGPAFNFTFNGDSVSPATPGVDTSASNPITNGAAGSATNFSYSSGSLLTIATGATNIKGAVWSTTAKANTTAMVAYGTYGLGKFVAVGDSSPFDDGTGASGDTLYNGWTGDAAGASDATLITNASLWLATQNDPAALYFNSTAGGSLATAGSYTPTLAGTLPSMVTPGATTDVYFSATAAGSAALSAALPTALSVNSLTFGAGLGGAVTINGAGTLTVKAAAGAYAAGSGIVKLAGSGATTLNAPLALAASQNWKNSAATALTIAGPIALGANTLTLAGTGATAINGIISGTGGLAIIDAGARTLAAANTYSGATTLAGGTLTAAPVAYANLLGNAGGVDVQNGRLVLNYAGSSTPVAQVKALLASGYAQATPFATGQLRSTTLAAGRTLGYSDSGSAVTILITLPGDANLDGTVDFNDFLALQNNFGQSATRFDQGNFNYDGVTDFNDFLALQNNFGQSVTGATVAFSNLQVAAIQAFGLSAAVPEPATLALVGIGAMGGLLARRRRA